MNDFWNERIVRFNADAQLDLLERLGVDDPDWRTLGPRARRRASPRSSSRSRSTSAGSFASPSLDWPARLHAVVARRLRRRGLEPAARIEGPVAFLDRAAARLSGLRAAARAASAASYTALRYGPRPGRR